MTASDPQSAFEIGSFTGQFCILLLCAAGVIKLWKFSSLPETNRKCVRSLVVILVGWVGFGILNLFSGSIPKAFQGLYPAIFILLILVALILAFLGLFELKRQPGKYARGLGYGVFSLLICIFFLGIFAFGFFSKIKGGTPSTRTVHGKAGDPDSVEVHSMNFRLAPLGWPWMRVQLPASRNEFKLSYGRNNPQMFFCVLAEKISPDVSLATAADLAKLNMDGAFSDVRVENETPIKLAGVEGLQREIIANANNQELFFLQGFCVFKGYFYRLAVWGLPSDRNDLRKEASEWFSRFQIIDDDPQVSEDNRGGNLGSQSNLSFSSQNWSYHVDLHEKGWRQLSEKSKQTHFRATQKDRVFIELTTIDPVSQISCEDLAAALFVSISEDPHFDDLDQFKSVSANGAQGVQIELQRSQGGIPCRYLLRSLKGKGVNYLLLAWGKAPEIKAAELNQALNSIQIQNESKVLPDRNSMSSADRQQQSLILNKIGLFLFDKGRLEEALRYFNKAMYIAEVEPTVFYRDYPIYIQNAAEALVRMDRLSEARSLIEGRIDQVDSNGNASQLRVKLAQIQEAAGAIDEAISNYRSVFVRGYLNDLDFGNYINLLSQKGDQNSILPAIENYRIKSDTPAIQVLQASMLFKTGEKQNAVELLKSCCEKIPSNEFLATALIQTYFEMENWPAAYDLCQKWVQKSNDPQFFFLKGLSEFRLKHYKDARASFEVVLKKNPAAEECKTYLNLVQGILGEGANRELTKLIKPVEIPKEFLARPFLPIAGKLKDAEACFLKHIRSFYFDKGKETKFTEYQEIRILQSSGIAKFSSLQFEFNPLSEEVYVNKVIVRDPDGKVLFEGKPEDYYIIDQHEDEIVSQHKWVIIPISGLCLGSTIEAEWTKRYFGHQDRFPYLVLNLSHTVPTAQSTVLLMGDFKDIKYETNTPIKETKSKDMVTLEQSWPPIYRSEPFQADPETFLSMIFLGSDETWENEAKEYRTSLTTLFELNEQNHQLAVELTQNIPNTLDKAIELACFVQTNITYKAIEFGSRGLIPQKPDVTLSKRCGDCKDHALLLQQLLNSAGVPSHLALVNANSKIRKSFPSMDQFNHVIVYTSLDGHDHFFDCTDKGSSMAQMVPLGLANKDILVLEDEKPRFVQIPSYPADCNHITISREVTWTNNTSAYIHTSFEAKGYPASLLRSFLKDAEITSRNNFLQRYFASKQHEELQNIVSHFVEEPSKPMQASFSYVCDSALEPDASANDSIRFQPPISIEEKYLLPEKIEKRITPCAVSYPLKIESTMKIPIPMGMELSNVDSFRVEWKDPYSEFHAGIEVTQTGLFLMHQIFLNPAQFDAEKYEDYRQSMNRILKALEQKLVFKKK